MLKPSYMGLALLLISAAGWAQEPVARIIDLKASQSRPLLQHRKITDNQWYPAFVGTEAMVSDHFKTDAQTVAALEFFIGGRVAIARNTDVEIVTERSVSSIEPSIKRVILRDGALWMKSGGRLAHPLEIQTNGGTMGIKGTEFTLESHPDANTKLVVLEGAVEVQKDKYLSVAKAGDVYEDQPNKEPEQRHLSAEEVNELKRQFKETNGLGEVGLCLDVLAAQVELQGIQDTQKKLQTSIPDLLDKVNHMQGKGEDSYYLAAPYQAAIRAGVSPSGGSQLSVANESPSVTMFSWKEQPGADGYVVFVSDSPGFANILYSDRVRDTRTVYPSAARPLAAGRYYWRVIPVQSDDNVVAGALAQQAAFVIPAHR